MANLKIIILSFSFISLKGCFFNEVLEEGIGNTFVKINNPNHGNDFISTNITEAVSGTCSKNIIKLETSIGKFLDADCSDGTWSLEPQILNAYLNIFIITAQNISRISVSDTLVIINESFISLNPFLLITSPNGGKNFTTSTLVHNISGVCSSDMSKLTSSLGEFLDSDCSDGTWSLKPYSLLDNVTIITITANSSAGINIIKSITINYDNTPPSAPIVSGTLSTTNKKPTWTWQSTGGGGDGVYRYKLNNNDFSSYFNITQNTYYTPTNNLENGSHTIYVQEKDEHDNWSDSGFYTILVESFYPLLSWGLNNYGQLGDNPSFIIPYFTELNSLEDVIKLSAGENYTLALKEDGSLWSWGRNNYGQLGDNTTINRTLPVQVQNISNVENISAGRYHSLAIKEDGSLWSWGYNNYGQLGLANTSTRYVPNEINAISDIKGISAGLHHSLAIKEDGSLWSWGRNNYGQLGDGTTSQKTSPIEINQDINGLPFVAIKQVSAGEYHSLAIKEDGSLWSWGYNNRGQLGDGTTINRVKPAQVLSLNNIEKVVAGGYYSLAIDANGDLFAWGYNNSGQLGDGTTTQKLLPVQITSGLVFTSIFANNSSSAAIDNNMKLWVWGYNTYGNLGLNHILNRTVPTLNEYVTSVEDIALAYYHIVVRKNGVFSSGSNNLGQLGLGFDLNKNIPSEILSVADTDFVDIKGGQEYSVALKTDNSVWTWGRNNYGQLGLGSTTNQNIPVLIPSDNLLNSFDDVTEIATGANFALAIRSDKTAWSWGYNNRGQLGLGNTTNTTRPTRITTVEGFKNISAGFTHSLGLKEDGLLWSWGYNNRSQLGLGDTTQRVVPFRIDYDINLNNFSNIKLIFCGAYHSLGLKEDGLLWSWGYNNYGQLGDGTNTTRTRPKQVLENVVLICAGAYHNLALKADNKVWTWGYNNRGQLGDGTINNSSTPIELVNLYNIVDIACGAYHSAARSEDGTIYIWGNNLHGQLGIASYDAYFSLPQEISNLLNVVKIGLGENHSLIIRANQ